MKLNKRVVASIALVAILLMTLTAPVWAQVPLTRMRNVTIQILSVTAGLTTDDLTTTDDVVVGDALTVAGATTLTGDAALTAGLVVGTDLNLAAQTAISLTMNAVLTPTGSLQPLESAGAVSISGADIADGTAGDVLVLLNIGAQTITITETTGLISAGNITLGTLDSATLVYHGTSWYQIGASNN